MGFKHNIGLKVMLCSFSDVCEVALAVLCGAAAKVRCGSWVYACVYRLSIALYSRSICEL